VHTVLTVVGTGSLKSVPVVIGRLFQKINFKKKSIYKNFIFVPVV
jgi:hypothetical protein